MDTFGFDYAWRSNNICLSAWRISWHHKCMDNYAAVPHRRYMKWSLHVCIAFSVKVEPVFGRRYQLVSHP